MNKSSASYDAYNQVASPEAGTRTPAGKDSANAEDTLRRGSLPAAQAVETAKAVDGKAAECIETQVGQNGNPKKRDTANWGNSREVMKTAKKLGGGKDEE